MDAAFLSYALLGLAAGVLVGVSGVGGGSLVTPALALSGVPAAVAVGTDLAFAAITKTFGAAVHRAQGSVDWRVAGLLAAGSCPAALLVLALLATGGAHAGERLITATLALALIGALVTLSSIGAGALGAMALVLLYPRLPARQVAGTDIAHAVPLTLVGGAGHLWLGTVDALLLASLLAGSLPGIVAGSLLAGRLPDTLVRGFLALVLFAAGARFALAAA